MPLEPTDRKLISKQKKQAKYDPDYVPEENGDGEDDDDEVDADDSDNEMGEGEESNNMKNLKERLQVVHEALVFIGHN